MKKSSKPGAESFDGWKVVWAILVVLTFASGLSFYNHSVILDALARDPQFSVESASWAVSLFFVSAGFTGLWLGRLLQRFDPRWCISAGALMSAMALTGLGWVDSLLELYAVYCLFGAGFSASGLLPCTTLVARWFQRRRAVALSVATTGLSLGGVVITPVCAALVNKLGLQGAAPLMGLAYVVGVIPVTWLFIQPEPPVSAEEAESAKQVQAGTAAPAEAPGLSYGQAMRHRFFWSISFAFVFLMMAQVGGIAHQFGLATEVLNPQKAAAAVAILPVASIIGRLLGGWVLNHVALKGFSLAMILGQLAALTALSLASGEIVLYASLALFGATVGNLLMLQPLLVAEAFGMKDYTRIFAISSLMMSLGTAVGPGLLGLVYAMQSSYSLAYSLAAGASLVGLLCFMLAGRLPVKATAARASERNTASLEG